MSIFYHPDKDNIVVNDLNRLSMGSLAHVDDDKQELVKNINHLAYIRVCLIDSEDGEVLLHRVSQLSLIVEIKEKNVGSKFD